MGLLWMVTFFAKMKSNRFEYDMLHMKKIINSDFFLPICFLLGFLLGEILIWIYK